MALATALPEAPGRVPRPLPPEWAWFEDERGIKFSTLEAFGIGRAKDAIAIPYPGGTKYRTLPDVSPRRFWYSDGFKLSLFNAREAGAKTVFICEGETDTMRLWQEMTGAEDVGVVGIPGAQSWKSEWAELMRDAETVYVILDNDADYNVKAQVDNAWLNMRRDLGPKAKRIKLPMGIKDVCEFFRFHNMEDLRLLVVKPVSRFRPLDLSDVYTPKPVNWLVEGLIGQGDLTLLFGEPNVGKSWLSMSLALGMVQGWDTWLGLPLRADNPRVLYVDEENPEDVIYQRLRQLGIRQQDTGNFRYLHEQGIRLDKDPDALMEEAIAFEPGLIVLDSLTRIHTENENDAGAIARLFNDGIKPLARQTGASVLVLHHARKPGADGSSYSRARGSGDITASVDTGLDVRQPSPGWMTVVHFKSRRRLPRKPITARLLDMDDGHVQLVTNVEAPPPF